RLLVLVRACCSSLLVSLVLVPPHPGLALTHKFGTGFGLRVHALEVLFTALVTGRPVVGVEPGVKTTRSGDELGRRGERQLPVEDNAVVATDDDRGPSDGARLEQSVFDAELGKPVGQEADGLFV